MKILTDEAMQQIDGGFDWADFTCGAALAVAGGGIVLMSMGTAGLAAPLAFAIGYSAVPASCAIAAFT